MSYNVDNLSYFHTPNVLHYAEFHQTIMLILFLCHVCYSRMVMYFYVLPVFVFDLLCLTPLSSIFQLYRGDQLYWWRKPEYPQRTTNHGQATGKLYYLRLRVECIFFVIYQAGANPRFILLFSFDFLLQSGGAVVAVIV